MSRDMTQKEFDKACAEAGFKPAGFMGYFSIDGAGNSMVSIWNAGKRRRDQLAYLIKEKEKHEWMKETHPRMFHESDGVITGVVVDRLGYRHLITHCPYCKQKMSTPVTAKNKHLIPAEVTNA